MRERIRCLPPLRTKRPANQVDIDMVGINIDLNLLDL
jgi:hypothetical protein